jgi:hypothetical protein
LQVEETITRSTIHGQAAKGKSTEYKSYQHAKHRCNNSENPAYDQYGGRGIKFLFDNFDHFLSELGFKPSSGHSLDRINNDGNYEPGNVLKDLSGSS